MDDVQRRQCAAALVLLCPVMAWIMVALKTEALDPRHKIKGLYNLTFHTLDRPFLLLALAGGVLVGGLLAWLLLARTDDAFSGARFNRFLRGTRITSPAKLARMTQDSSAAQVTLAGIPIPTNAENLHMLIGGGTGSGKSTLFREIALGAERQIPVIPSLVLLPRKLRMPGGHRSIRRPSPV